MNGLNNLKRNNMKQTILQFLVNVLEELDIRETISKDWFVKKHWWESNYYTRRSFDVLFCRAKKLIPDKTFEGKYNHKITRIS
jgi:hypothetical protein